MYGPRRWIEGPWACRPVPLPDELLSSYLWRAAEGIGLKPIGLLNGAFGSSRSLLNQDLDAFVSDPVLARLCEGSGLDEEDLRAMTLGDHLGTLQASAHPRGRKTWILPTTILSNARLRHGLQFCPACLRQDGRAYLRRRWRLAFSTTCTEHAIDLLDRCPDCGTRIRPHDAPSLRDCHACGASLASAASERTADPRIVARQREHEAALDKGVARIGVRPLHAAMYFVALRRLAALVSTGPRAEAVRGAIAARHGDDPSPFERENARHPIEYLDVEARRRLFGLVDRLLQDWPKGFVDICRKAGATRSFVVKDMANVPFALDGVLRAHLDDTPYHASDAEVAAAAAWLRRTTGVATYRDLKALCGEARVAIYRHMDYERIPRTPSVWRGRTATSFDPDGSEKETAELEGADDR
jgi:hypothetical protein